MGENLYGKPRVRLVEPKNQECPEYSVDIDNMPPNSIVIKTDAFPAPKDFFNGDKGERKRADFVIIANTKDQGFIVFIEMKKGKGDNKKIIQQLKGAQCLMDYVRSIVNAFWGKSDFLAVGQWEHRFVSINHIGVNKRPTFPPPSNGIHDQAERALKISGTSHIAFKKLTGRHR